MVARLNDRPLARGLGLAAVAALVVALHVATIGSVADELSQWQTGAAPPRLHATYVRTLEPAPAPLNVAAPRQSVAPTSRRVATAVARAASQAAPLTPRPPSEASVEASPGSASADETSPPALATATATATAASSPHALGEAAGDVALASAPAASESVADASAAITPASDGFAWPVSTRVSYLLNGSYRGPINGRAEVEWIRVGERYQVEVSVSAGPSFAPFFSRRMTSAGNIAATGLVPARYDEDTRLATRERRASVVFAADGVELANGQKREPMPGVQDTASQFIQFTWLFGSRPETLHPGAVFDFPLALPRGMRRWTYDVVDSEVLATPLGPLQAYHLKPRLGERKPNELMVEMWFAPELRYLPVRIRIEQDDSTWLDLLIAGKPEMAAE